MKSVDEQIAALADELAARKKAYPSHPHWAAWDLHESDLRDILASVEAVADALPEATTVTEWNTTQMSGLIYESNTTDVRGFAEQRVRDGAGKQLVTRTRTTYADHVTDWVPAEPESVFDQSPYRVMKNMLKEHDGMDPKGVTCLGCGTKLAEPTGSWTDAAQALARHQWEVMGFTE